ncbi:hypothetical protein KY363_03180 [Candidatus Woesearchaeota archaeon]|nr:hypothetical protein [Candidatus Woesearchaeota archaeon]
MDIYVGHSGDYDYVNELYVPLRRSRLNGIHNLVLPHEFSRGPFDSKEFLRSCGIMIAELSYPSTPLGVEIGWADGYGVPVIGLIQRPKELSRSMKNLISELIEYSDSQQMVFGIERVISRLTSS